MTKRLAVLLAGSLLGWGLAAYPAYRLGGPRQLTFSAVAAGLCLAPALVTLVAAEWAFRKKPEVYLLTVLGGTGLRLFGVLGGGLALSLAVPDFRHTGFFLWVGVFYFLTLALEMAALLAGRTRVGNP